NESPWVKQELAAAFELSSKKQLALIPVLITDADIPFLLKGLLYIDARTRSFDRGLSELVDFFEAQAESGYRREPPLQGNDIYVPRVDCEVILHRMKLGDLRYLLTERLNVHDISVLWFDMFEET